MNNQLSAHHFYNLVTLALIEEDFDQINELLETKIKYLGDELTHKECVVQLTEARVLLFKGQVEESWERLKGFSSADMLYQVFYQKLLLKIYYLIAPDNLGTMSDTFRRKVKRKGQLRVDTMDANTVFLECLRTLVKGQELDLEKVRSNLSLIDYYWLKKIQKKN